MSVANSGLQKHWFMSTVFLKRDNSPFMFRGLLSLHEVLVKQVITGPQLPPSSVRPMTQAGQSQCRIPLHTGTEPRYGLLASAGPKSFTRVSQLDLVRVVPC